MVGAKTLRPSGTSWPLLLLTLVATATTATGKRAPAVVGPRKGAFVLVPLPCVAAGEGTSALYAVEVFRAGYAAGVRSKWAGVLYTAGPCHATRMAQPQPLSTIWPHRWLLPAVPQVAFATVIPSAFIVSGRV